MKKNLYYQAVFQRRNFIKELLFALFMDIASFPRLVIEVFIRQNMGRRYFRRSYAIISAIVLLLLPFIVNAFTSSFSRSFGYRHQDGFWDVVKSHWLWYLFVIAFCFFSYLRYRDVKHITAQFDLDHFSKSSGDFLPFFSSLKFNGKLISVRTLEIYIEPLSVFIIGFLLNLIGQGFLGWFLMICAVIYSLSYAGSYMIGDNFILDKIDEIICNGELSTAFTSDEEPKRGFRFYGEKPTSQELRDEILNNTIIGDDDNDFTEAV